MIFSACLPKLPCHSTSVATSLTTSHYISLHLTTEDWLRDPEKQYEELTGNIPTSETVRIQLLGDAAESMRIGKWSWTTQDNAGLQVLISDFLQVSIHFPFLTKTS